MKKLLLWIAVLSAAAWAQTTTPNYGFNVPSFNTPNWNYLFNANFFQLDSLIHGIQVNETPIGTFTVGTLPTGVNLNTIAGVTDASGLSCTVGGGSINILCRWNGSSWVPFGITGYVDFSSNQSIGGVKTFTQQLQLANSGLFTNTQISDYVSSFIGGFTDDYTGTGFTDAIIGGITTPSFATSINNVAVVGRGISNCNSFVRTVCNTVGGYFVGRANALGAGVWGINPLAFDDVGIANAQITGSETDIGVGGTPLFVRGNTVVMSLGPHGSGTVPVDSIGMEVLSMNTPTLRWNRGLQIDDGSASLHAIQIGATQSTGISLPSLPIAFARFDSGGIRHADVTINSDATGDLILIPAPTAGVNVPILSITNPTNQLQFPTTHGTVISVPDPAAIRTDVLPDAGANAFIGLTLNGTNGVYESKRNVAGCTTGASLGNPCASAVTVSLSAPFVDTNYSAGCNPVGAPTNFPGSPYVVTKSVGSFTVNYIALTAAAASWPNLDCWAIHD